LPLTRRVEPRLQIGENRIEGGAQRDQKAPLTLSITLAADVAFAKARSDTAQIAPETADIAAFAQVLGMRAGIAIEPPEHLGDVAINVVYNRRRECRPPCSRERDARMNPLVAPPLGLFAEECAMGRPPERRAPSPAHQPRADVVVDRNEVPCGRRVGSYAPNLRSELRWNPLVGIDFEDPVTAAHVDAGVTARPFPLPSTFDEAVGEPVSDLARPIGAAVEDDNDLIGKAQTAQAFGQLPLLVVDNDKDGEGGLQRPVHASAFVTERHRRHAAASASSTERPSISVSVVR